MFAIPPRLGVQIVIVLAVLWTIGCDRSHENAAPAALHGGLVDLPGVLVDSQWLSDHLSDENLVIVDARTAREYADGHVHGAIHLQPGALLDPDPRNNKNMAPIHHVEKMLGSVGLDMGRTVVIYDAGSDYRAAQPEV